MYTVHSPGKQPASFADWASAHSALKEAADSAWARIEHRLEGMRDGCEHHFREGGSVPSEWLRRIESLEVEHEQIFAIYQEIAGLPMGAEYYAEPEFSVDGVSGLYASDAE